MQFLQFYVLGKMYLKKFLNLGKRGCDFTHHNEETRKLTENYFWKELGDL